MGNELGQAEAAAFVRTIRNTGITVRQLAIRADIDESTLRRRLNAPMTFTLSEVANICDAIDMPLHRVFEQAAA
jgi:lambda repressor-like predicted transcriptional regulator